MKKIIIIIVVIAVVAAGGFILLRSSDSTDTDTQEQDEITTQPAEESSTSEEEAAEGEAEEAEQVAATITYTDSGFSVDNQTVAAGSTVEIVNQSDSQLDFASNVHPVHSDNSEFNVGIIEAGDSTTFVVNETGTWGFHNHLNSSQLGEITVE